MDAVIEGSREKALQCLLLDPVITDIETGRNILDDYFLTSYKEYLPQFWEVTAQLLPSLRMLKKFI